MVMNETERFEIAEESEGADRIHLRIQGDLDVDTSPRLYALLNRCFNQNIHHIHIALDEVPRMDSSGIATLVAGLRWSQRSGGRFVLTGLTEAVRDLFVLSKLDQEFEVVAEGAN